MSDEKCPWCPHPVSAHSAYVGGWCAAEVMVIDAFSQGSITPYNYHCWCGGTEETRGPRIVSAVGDDIHLVPGEPIGVISTWRPA